MAFYIRHLNSTELPLLGEIEISGAACFAQIDGLADKTCRSPLPIDVLANFEILVAITSPIPECAPRLPETRIKAIQEANQRQTAVLAEDSLAEVIMGFVALRPMDSATYIAQISVAAPYQQKGVGTALMARAEEEIKLKSGDTISLGTYLDVPWNGPWYKKMGYTVLTDKEVEYKLGPKHVLRLEDSRAKQQRQGWDWAIMAKFL